LFVEMMKESLTDIMYIASTSDPNEAVIKYPSVLVFHTHNWDASEYVRVQGVDDGVNDGDENSAMITSPQPHYSSPYWGYLEDVNFRHIDNKIVPTTALTIELIWKTNE